MASFNALAPRQDFLGNKDSGNNSNNSWGNTTLPLFKPIDSSNGGNFMTHFLNQQDERGKRLRSTFTDAHHLMSQISLSNPNQFTVSPEVLAVFGNQQDDAKLYLLHQSNIAKKATALDLINQGKILPPKGKTTEGIIQEINDSITTDRMNSAAAIGNLALNADNMNLMIKPSELKVSDTNPFTGGEKLLLAVAGAAGAVGGANISTKFNLNEAGLMTGNLAQAEAENALNKFSPGDSASRFILGNIMDLKNTLNDFKGSGLKSAVLPAAVAYLATNTVKAFMIDSKNNDFVDNFETYRADYLKDTKNKFANIFPDNIKNLLDSDTLNIGMSDAQIKHMQASQQSTIDHLNSETMKIQKNISKVLEKEKIVSINNSGFDLNQGFAGWIQNTFSSNNKDKLDRAEINRQASDNKNFDTTIRSSNFGTDSTDSINNVSAPTPNLSEAFEAVVNDAPWQPWKNQVNRVTF